MSRRKKKKIERLSDKYTTQEIEKIIKYAWLNIDNVHSLQIDNKILNRTEFEKENPHLHVLSMMRKPEYFYWLCKTVFNITIHPFQAVILSELWVRPFPMLIASRGASKTFTMSLYAMIRALLCQGTKTVCVGAAFRQSKFFHSYMCSIWNNAPILRDLCGNKTDKSQGPKFETDRLIFNIGKSTVVALPIGTGETIRGERANFILADEFGCVDGMTLVETDKGLVRIGDREGDINVYTGDESCPYEKPAKLIKTPLTDVYEVKMSNGYVIKCSSIHQFMTNKGWKDLKDLQEGDWIESINNYQFPTEQVEEVDERLAYLMGLLISEGFINNRNYFTITSTDRSILERIQNLFPELSNMKIYTKKDRQDKRGWKCKECYDLHCCNTKFRDRLFELGLDYSTSHSKKIPWSILRSPKNVVIAFLRGLFEGDGSCFTYTSCKKNPDRRIVGLNYYSVSEVLCRDVQVLINKLGFDSSVISRNSKLSDKLQWFVRLNSCYAREFAELLNVERFKDVIENSVPYPGRKFNGVRKVTYQKNGRSRVRWLVTNTYLDKIKYKTFLTQEEANKYLLELQKRPTFRKVVSIKKLDKKQHLYDYYLPKTHSFYAGGVRNHNSQNPEIYETVIAGFGSVSADPVNNVIMESETKKKIELGLIKEEDLEVYKGVGRSTNQSVLSGTADYSFKHFAQYWRRYKAIVESKGDREKLLQVISDEDLENGFDWRDYSIMRIPYNLLPYGFLDSKTVARSRATVHLGIFQLEFGAVFSSDSKGFFKRSLIESCCAPVQGPDGDEIHFTAQTIGNLNSTYIYGIDPASEQDNFSVVILQVLENHRRIVYSWTTNRQRHIESVRAGIATENDFYGYCARKIRTLMKKFPCSAIALDSQGGGVAVAEALHDNKKLERGEKMIWPIIEEGKQKDSDDQPGLHIIHLINFADAKWTAAANHGLRKDFEDKVLLFPFFDTVEMAKAMEYESDEEKKNFLYDSLEDCLWEIEELKNELTTITHTQTPGSNRDRWDTPEIKEKGGKKGRLRKDRYSSLVMANMVARTAELKDRLEIKRNMNVGGAAQRISGSSFRDGGDLYSGPDWFTSQVNSLSSLNMVVRKNTE